MLDSGRATEASSGVRTVMPGWKASSGRTALGNGPVKKVSESSVCGRGGRDGALLCPADGITDGACGTESAAAAAVCISGVRAVTGCSTKGAGKALTKADKGLAAGDGGAVVSSKASAPLNNAGRARSAIIGAAVGAGKTGRLITEA
jgi:hypothetical protein